MLLSIVIGTIIKIKDNNIAFLEKFSASQQFNTYVSLAISSYTKKIKNENVYLDEVADFGDDDIRRKLKLIKVVRKDKEIQKTSLGDGVSATLVIRKSTYQVGDSHKSDIYTISLE